MFSEVCSTVQLAQQFLQTAVNMHNEIMFTCIKVFQDMYAKEICV